MHQVAARGPEGASVYYDEKGKRVKGGGRVDHVGFRDYLDRLRAIALGDSNEEADILIEQKSIDRSMRRVERVVGGGG